MLDIICLHRLMKYLVYKQHSVTNVFSQTLVPHKVASFNFFIMYIELDHNLVPGKILDINEEKTLPTGKESKENDIDNMTCEPPKKKKRNQKTIFNKFI